MKKFATVMMTALLALACCTSALAEGTGNVTEKDVFAKLEYLIEGEATTPVENGSAAVTVEGDITLTVTDIPESAVGLVIFPIPASETEAWSWITACLRGEGKLPVHPFGIYFVDADGNRTNASGATVTLDCPHCTNQPVVCSLRTDGTVAVLNNGAARTVSVTFTTDGSPYYVITEKIASYTVTVMNTVGGSVECSTLTPKPGDTVTVTAKPNSGKKTDKITVTDESGNELALTDCGDGSYSFVQPESNVTVDVIFAGDLAQTELTIMTWATVGSLSITIIGVVLLFCFKKGTFFL